MADQKSKHQKPKNGDKETANVTETKTLTNIYYDCLERIFDFLDLQSLLNIACTCKRLQIAAAAKYGDAFGKRCVCLTYNRIQYNMSGPTVYEICGTGIGFRSVKFCFPFLRCFGAKISKLLIVSLCSEHRTYPNDDFMANPNDELMANNVYRYMNQYCADTLTSIEFYDNQGHFIKNIQKPFKNVTEITNVHFDDHLPIFLKFFPNVRELRLSDRRLNIHITPINTPITEITLSEILDMISQNPSISWLSIRTNRLANVNMAELTRFISEHPLIEKLYFQCSLFSVENAMFFIRQMKSLKCFGFYVKDRSEHDRLLDQLDKGHQWKCFFCRFIGEKYMVQLYQWSDNEKSIL